MGVRVAHMDELPPRRECRLCDEQARLELLCRYGRGRRVWRTKQKLRSLRTHLHGLTERQQRIRYLTSGPLERMIHDARRRMADRLLAETKFYAGLAFTPDFVGTTAALRYQVDDQAEAED